LCLELPILEARSKAAKIMWREKNTNTVNIRYWEQVSFLPKIKHTVSAWILTLSRANGGNTSTPDIDRRIFSRRIRKTKRH